MPRTFSLEQKILAIEIASYVIEREISLEKAYEDKMVPKEEQMTKDEIQEILSEIIEIL